MSSSEIWLINTHTQELTIPMLNINPPRIVKFRPNYPLPFPREIGLLYQNNYRTIRVCDEPKKFLNGQKIKHLIVRDAGIGDLILMEPCFRELAKLEREISLVTHFSDLFTTHPAINDVTQMRDKSDFDSKRIAGYDLSNDMRNYSERHDKRADWHRTDIYASGFGIELEDKEPRIYADVKPKALRKKKGFTYVGFQFDASENYRKFPAPRAKAIIEHFLARDPKVIPVLLGNRQYVTVDDDRVIDLQGKTDLLECLDFIYDLDYMFAADSGLLHVALAMHIPTLAWFSLITPDLRMRYYTGRKSILEPLVKCHPCGNMNSGGCMHGDASGDPDYKVPLFMAPCSDIPVESVYDQLIGMERSDAPMVYKGKGA